MPGPYTRTNPFPAKLSVNRSLCGEDSEKDTRHFELDLKGWGLNYEVGDSMTVWPTNDRALVDELINKIAAKGDEPVKGPNGDTTLREALFRDCRITQTTPKFLKAIAERAVNGAPLLTELLTPERKQDLDTYLWGMEVVDFLIEHPSIKWTPQDLVDTLAKLMPRLYSISSSLKTNPDREHCNYFYKEELEDMKRDAFLTRLDCAWSRDQAGKSYVQNKMLENAAEIWKWMDAEGTHFFVCGDARRMAKDVDAALRKIIQEQGGKTEEQTNQYVEKLKSDKRYKRDVY